jgi:hypothetical protein
MLSILISFIVLFKKYKKNIYILFLFASKIVLKFV